MTFIKIKVVFKYKMYLCPIPGKAKGFKISVDS